MLQPKQLLKFSLWTVVLTTLLLYPWSFVDRGYARAFQAVNTQLFSRFWFWSAGQAVFIDLRAKDVVQRMDDATPGDLRTVPNLPVLRPTDVLDTLVIIMNRELPGPFGQFRVGSRQIGYWPTAWLLVLILAKPLPPKRKAWAFFWGMLLVHAFIAFRVSIDLLQGGLAIPGKKYAVFHLGPFWQDALTRMNQMFVDDPTISFIVPTLIWFLVAFTRHDWAALRQLAVREPDEAESQT